MCPRKLNGHEAPTTPSQGQHDLAGCLPKVALAHGLNANLVHKWRRLASPCEDAATPAPSIERFIALPLAPSTPVAAADIRIELRRGTTSVAITWPASAATECAAWMRELLK